jgi:hypothetical protein
MKEDCAIKHITTAATTSLSNVSAYIEQIVYCCTSIGATWTFAVQDRGDPAATPPIPIQTLVKVAVVATTTPDQQKVFYDRPMPMRNGVDVVTTGTPGALDIWVHGFIPEEGT